MVVCLICLCVGIGPVMDRRPVQGVLCLSPDGSNDIVLIMQKVSKSEKLLAFCKIFR